MFTFLVYVSESHVILLMSRALSIRITRIALSVVIHCWMVDFGYAHIG